MAGSVVSHWGALPLLSSQADAPAYRGSGCALSRRRQHCSPEAAKIDWWRSCRGHTGLCQQRRQSRAARSKLQATEEAQKSLENSASLPVPGTTGADAETALIGEDAASFDVRAQSAGKWAFFTVELAVVLAALYVVWIAPSPIAAGSAFVAGLERVSDDSSVVMVAILAVFALVHSGLAAARPWGESLVGPRAFRVVFAGVSLPLAFSALMYFVNHRYDGPALWNLRGQPGVHSAVWALNFVSFLFLYPSTFNLLEAFGQALWCAAHMVWIGSGFMAATSGALLAHHAFACWHGDARLRARYGPAFEAVRARTSVLPFAAILEGRQQLPADYWREWARLPYLTITLVTLGTYWAHPLMQRAAHWLGW